MSKLRNKLIRLAHEKPHLRSYLVPLLKTAGDHDIPTTWLGNAYFHTGNSGVTFMIGYETWNNESDSLSSTAYNVLAMNAQAFGHNFGNLRLRVSRSSLQRFAKWAAIIADKLPVTGNPDSGLLADEVRLNFDVVEEP